MVRYSVLGVGIVVAGLMLGALSCGGEEAPALEDLGQPVARVTTEPTVEKGTTSMTKQYDSPPAMTIDPTKSYTATVEMEKGGEIVIELLASEAPQTVNNFVFLARDGYYDGVTFHRVLADFMAQSGDPTGLGTGGPGYTISDEFSPNARHDTPGTLSMANTGRPNTGGGQWFITFGPTPWLDDAHAVFGKVTNGMDVVNGIPLRDPATATTPGDAIKTIRIDES
jgi:cyclophilin family peptidyl-prolyl cis-trans isomerase